MNRRFFTSWTAPAIRLWNRFLTNPTALLISLLMVGTLGIGGLLANSARQENLEFRSLLQRQVSAGLSEQMFAVGRTLADYAVWDEFNDKVNRADLDMKWLSDNLTPSIYSNMDIDLALLIDPHQRSILYAIKFGQVLPTPNHAFQFSEREWRWLEQAMRIAHKKAQYTAMVHLEEQDGRSNRQLFLVAAHPVENEQGIIPARQGKLLLFAREFDASLLENLSSSYLIRDPRIRFVPERDPSRMSQAVRGLAGTPVAWFSWSFSPPGDALLTRLIPGAATLCLILFGLGYLLGQQARRLQRAQTDTVDRLRRQGSTLRSIVEQPAGEEPGLQHLQDLCWQIAATLGADEVGIWRHDAATGKLGRVAAADAQGGCDFDAGEWVVDADYLQQLEACRYLALNDLADVPSSLRPELGRQSGVRSRLDATVRVDRQMYGIVSVGCHVPRIWTLDEINFICSTADVLALITETNARQEVEGELSRQFYYDRGTGLPNHHKLRQHLDAVTSQPHPHAGACVLVVLSNLAAAVDAYGGDIGEQLIARIAARLYSETRAGEMASRMGEARFALWLEGGSETELTARLNRLQLDLLVPLQIENRSVHPRFLIGVSLFPGDGYDAKSLLQQAGSAIQHASKLSRQSWVRFNSGLSEERRQKHRLQMELREALERSQLHLHYQPFVDLQTGAVVGAEALLRWDHPEKGAISPGVFIPMAEEDDALINSLGAWVLDRACAQIAQWRREHSPSLFIAVNVSVRQMETAGFRHVVASTLARYGLPTDAIELELTESIAASDAPDLELNLKALQQMGVSLAIDDFGTGYASFGYLRRFPVVRLKIDRQFFEGVPENPQSSNLVKMIVAMSHVMGAQVIGEGVESAEQVAFLKQIGGDFAQGYFFSRPLPPGEMEALLDKAPYAIP
jgi:diguanylate cyclase (GGDEF)-like protein